MSPAAPAEAALAEAAPAKLNLYLKVLGRRPDGYHLLDSLVAFVDLADRLEVEPADGLTLAVDGPFATRAGPVADNLVLRAARALREASGTARGARLRLTKSIPVEAGLGGGSADAAAALRLLGGLWGLDLGERRLAETALALGADVPVCLLGRPALMAGIGERLAPAPPLPPCGVLLVNPGVATATPAVFRAHAGLATSFSPAAPPLPSSLRDAAHLAAELRARGNDLVPAACAVAPAVADALAELERVPGALHVSMSGSGATCFALFVDAGAARRGAARLAERRPGWWSHAGSLRS